MIDENPIRTRYQAVRPSLDERGRRLHAAAEAATAGRGGVAATSRATKVARSTIGRGLKDLRAPGSLTGKVRRKGAGRPIVTAKAPNILGTVEPLDPQILLDPPEEQLHLPAADIQIDTTENQPETLMNQRLPLRLASANRTAVMRV